MAEGGVAEARGWVVEGHEHVSAGRYADAAARFEAALPVLRALLGEAHEEVVLLEEDVRTVRSMAAMGRLVAALDVDERAAAVWRPAGSG